MLRRIEQEIEEIEAAIASFIAKIQATYAEYAQVVAQAVQQQLVLAAYHICTRDCPQKFLALSLAERQKLQQELQIAAKSAVDTVTKILLDCGPEQQTDQEAIDRLLVKTLAEASRSANDVLVAAGVLNLPLLDDSPKIQLRLSEVEFTNRTVMSHRGELRVFSARLQQLYDELEKKRKTKVIAEAELAWRATWTEYN